MLSPFISIFSGLTKEMQGEVLGINASVQALATAIPAAMAGYIATIGINVPVIVGGSFVLFGGIEFNIFYRPSKKLLHEDAGQFAAGH